jgi:ABC-type Fe3+/spermidine/putrescine transport system ATPase subunit
MPLLQVVAVTKSFDDQRVLHEVSLDVEEDQVACLLGPSGCGKTTLLRIIAGLETADHGYVVFAGRRLEDVPVHRRGFGLMFQDFALFPHKDVAANVAFGLRMQSLSRSEVEARVAEMLDLVGLAGYEGRQVFDLSGGEQQRVALARSLAPGPRLLMLDEPLGSLDRALREELMNELRSILREVGVTAVYVTHDQQEAFAVADQVLVMRAGSIVQRGRPQAVYRHPASAWVARFLGLTNLVEGKIVSSDPLTVETALGCLRPADAYELAPGRAVTALIRPEAARLPGDSPAGETMSIQGTVRGRSFRGSHYRLVIEHAQGHILTFELVTTADRLPRLGEEVTLGLRPDAITLLSEQENE